MVGAPRHRHKGAATSNDDSAAAPTNAWCYVVLPLSGQGATSALCAIPGAATLQAAERSQVQGRAMAAVGW